MEQIHATLESDGKSVSLLDFAEYFRLLRGCYVLALEEAKLDEDQDSDEDVAVAEMTATDIADSIRTRAAAMSPDDFEAVLYQVLPADEDLWLRTITRRNPFEIVFEGIAIALTAALIVSGGTLTLGPGQLKINLPPLGDGIKKLRLALRRAIRQKKK